MEVFTRRVYATPDVEDKETRIRDLIVDLLHLARIECQADLHELIADALDLHTTRRPRRIWTALAGAQPCLPTPCKKSNIKEKIFRDRIHHDKINVRIRQLNLRCVLGAE